MEQIEGRLTVMESKLEKLQVLEDKTNNTEMKVMELQKTVADLTATLDDIENRSRRNNLIIQGVPEEEMERDEGLTRRITSEIFSKRLGLEIRSIERCHRLGRGNHGKPRAVIIKFIDYREKLAVLRNSSKLKGTDLRISEDYSKLVRTARKCLWDSSQQERENGLRIKLRFDKMIVDNVTYGWDHAKGERYRCYSTRKN